MAKGTSETTVVVVGGGPVGGVAGILLARMGYQVRIVERRNDVIGGNEMEKNGMDRAVSKRSINLALSHRGLEALKKIGLHETALSYSVPMFGRAIHVDGKVTFQHYDESDHKKHINSISREQLNRLLILTAMKEPNVQVIFGQQLLSIDRNRVLHFAPADSVHGGSFSDCQLGAMQMDDASLVLGCDGAYSAVRESMLRLQSTNFSRRYISHGYKELEIPADALSKDYQLKPPHALHIWPKGDFMMIALPNSNRSFTCTIFAPLEELASLTENDEIAKYFERNFPDAIQYMPDYIDQFKANPACRLVTSTVDPWHLDGQVLLLGDAAHAQVPFYGQGMNSGMEDVLEFAETLETFGMDLRKAVPAFGNTRMPRGNGIVELSFANYVEMRSHTASKLFLLRKKLEGYLNWMFPKYWIPLYKMVTFTRIPYDEAIEREKRQEKTLRLLSGSLLALSAFATVGLALSFLPKRK